MAVGLGKEDALSGSVGGLSESKGLPLSWNEPAYRQLWGISLDKKLGFFLSRNSALCMVSNSVPI